MKKLILSISFMALSALAFAGSDVERAAMGTKSGGSWTITEAVTASVTGVVRSVSTSADLLAYANGGVTGKTRCANGDTIRMTTNITATAPINLASGVTLDLNQYTLNASFSTDQHGTYPAITRIKNGTVDCSNLTKPTPYTDTPQLGTIQFANGNFEFNGVHFTGNSFAGSADLLIFYAYRDPVLFKLINCHAENAEQDVFSAHAQPQFGLSSYGYAVGCEFNNPGSASATYNAVTTHQNFTVELNNCYVHTPTYVGQNPRIIAADIGNYNTPLIVKNSRISDGTIVASVVENNIITTSTASVENCILYYGENPKISNNIITSTDGLLLVGISAEQIAANNPTIQNNSIYGLTSTSGSSSGIRVKATDTGTITIKDNKLYGTYYGIAMDAVASPAIIKLSGNKIINYGASGGQDVSVSASMTASIVNEGNNYWGRARYNNFTPSLLDNSFGAFTNFVGLTSAPTITAKGIIDLFTQNFQGAGVGESISFSGWSDNGKTVNTTFAAVSGRKENSTNNSKKGYIDFYTANGTALTEQMRIDSAGNVGIGTTAPSALLQVGAGNFNVLSAGNTGIGTTTAPQKLSIVGDYYEDGLTVASASVSTVDDGKITLPTGVAGELIVWENTERLTAHVGTDGVISSYAGSTNTDDADTDGTLCVYDGGTGAVIRNRLGSTKTVRYRYSYS